MHHLFHSRFHGYPFLLVLVFVAVAGVELIVFLRSGKCYDLRGAAASIGVAVVHRIAGVAHLLLVVPVYALLWSHRLFTLELPAAAQFGVAFIAVEFGYYWMHRASHKIAWMWTNHSVHHSAEQLNFAAAVRLGATGVVTGEWVPFVPLVFLGIAPQVVTGLLGLNLLYQFFLHTETIPRLGPLEWVLNTPSHHRVHHASNRIYLDRNFGGVLIIFDRLFGTCVSERADEPPRYGLVGERRGDNPLRILFGGWLWLFSRVARARGWRARLRTLVGMS